jgi:DNA helicase-2/ATP-dependent DNA helicase PcrA
MGDSLLDDLDARQRAAVETPHVPLAIIAPAGSGKTRVLTRRIAYRIREERAVARHVLALTFTRKAAGELVDRLRRLGVDAAVTAGTFHAVALAQLRRLAGEQGREAPRVLDRKARVLAPLLGVRGAQAAVAVGEVAAEIEWAKARLVPPGRFAEAARAEQRRLPRPPSVLAELYERYEHELRRRRLLDFDDVLARCADAIARDPDVAAAQRFRFRHLFVDEFQDATPLQLRLLSAWLGDRADLTVVGDPDQAIYGFAGADASPLRRFGELFPGGETVTIGRNYRSTPAVVALASAALGPVASGTRAAPEAVRSGGPAPTFRGYDDDDAEAAAVAAHCRRAFTGGVPWHHMAVLFRTNAQSSRFEAAFTRRGVPFRVGGAARFTARPAVRMWLERLRTLEAADPRRPVSEHVADLAAEDDEELLASDDVREHRDALVDLGREFVAVDGGTGGVASFVAWLDVGTRGDDRAAGVELVTFHRAKGLEWPVVFVTGLERGLVPISWATADGAIAEERRLLHVALSRAADEVHCTWARARVVGGRRVVREPSPWLAQLEARARSVGGVPARAPADHVAEMRATLAATPPAGPKSRARRRRSMR